MNLLSEHNRILRVGEGGSQEYFAGPNINITDHVISGKYWDNEINSAISSTSGDIVNEAFNQSTAWTEEQGYLTAHQDVDNLPYVQNSALGYNGNLISSISGDGFFAESANNSYHADEADHADSATHADSADFVATANFANSASSALNAEVANVAYTALTAQFLDGGWELDVDGFITAYNNSAFAGGGAGGRYEGISPIVVNNEEMRISAKSALLGVQDPLYFVEDSETATVIGVYESAFSGDTTPYSAGSNIVINNHVIGLDSAIELTNITGNRGAILDPSGLYVSDLDQNDYTEIGLDHVVSTNGSASIGWQLDNKEISVSDDSGNGDYAILHMSTADVMLEERHQEPTPDKIYSLTGACTSAISAINMINSGDNQAYSAGANIDITNHVVSGKDWTNDIQNASSYAYDQATAQIPDVTGLPYVENSALDYTPGGHLVSSISGDALYAVSAEGAFNAETANYSYVAETANYVADGWEYNASNEITGYSGSAIHSEAGGEGKVYTGVAPIVVDNSQTTGVISAQTARLGVQEPLYLVEDTSASTVIGISGLPEVEGLMYESALGLTGGSITSYNGSAFSAQGGGHPQVPVSGVSGISITKPGDTVLIGISGDLTGQYIPYTATDTNKFITNSAIIVSAGSGYIDINSKNDYYSGEAHVHVQQSPTNLGIDKWWAEIDGDGFGHIQQHWSTSTGTDSAMWYEINGLTYTTGEGTPVMVAEWLTGDWINAKALYNHVNTASAGWGGGGGLPQSAIEAIETVTGSSANWNSTYNTVSTNSANWDVSTLSDEISYMSGVIGDVESLLSQI